MTTATQSLEAARQEEEAAWTAAEAARETHWRLNTALTQNAWHNAQDRFNLARRARWAAEAAERNQ